MSSQWFLLTVFLFLAVFMLAFASLPASMSNPASHYLPMEARYIEFFGLTKPVSSFFFWVLMATLGTGIFLRGVVHGGRHYLPVLAGLFALFLAVPAALMTGRSPVSTGKVSVDLPVVHGVEMEPSAVYDFNVHGSSIKASMRMTDAGPLIVQQSAKGLKAFLALSPEHPDARVRLCSPGTLHYSVTAILLDALAFLAYLVVFGMVFLKGKS